ncbi:MAG: rRNA maturation RNase YbeY [Pseudomonadota bacterium]
MIEVLIEEPGWEAHPLEVWAEDAATLALTARGLAPEAYEISLLACSDDRIAALNADFRGKPAPTNVLSWPAFALAPEAPGALPPLPPAGTPEAPIPLGDVAIALQTIETEARTASKPLKNHVLHLILHGSLHLLGFDHLEDADAVVMERVERQALATLGIPDPYLGDAAGPQTD